jgi:NitT/TauT family transport system permease protein
VLTILVVWEIYGRSTNPILFTYPTAVARAAVTMTLDGSLPAALAQSLSVLAIGFLVGTISGIALGLLAGRSAVAAALMELPVNALYATPMVALIPVLVLWFGFGVTAKIVIVTLFVVFPVLINTTRGVREVDPKMIEVAHSFCSSESRLWRDLVLPSALPFIVTGVRLAIGRGLIGIVVAEFYTAFSGLGYLIVDNANSFQTDRTFVPIVVLAALGIGLTAVVEWIEGRMAPWRSASNR